LSNESSPVLDSGLANQCGRFQAGLHEQ